jgi:hypothetical protein
MGVSHYKDIRKLEYGSSSLQSKLRVSDFDGLYTSYSILQ